MDTETLKSIQSELDKHIHALLVGNMDERSAWMLVLSCLKQIIDYQIDKEKGSDIYK